QNNDEDDALDGKEHDFDAMKHESFVILSSSSSAQTKQQDDKTKIEDKRKSHVESFTRYRDLNAEFEDCSENSRTENRVLVTKPHNKTPYELLHCRTPSIGFMRPFGCPVTILNTVDPLGKFQKKVDEGFLVGYS
nr:putative ribonuclease H-like domain-containing protein [Tanacetum cinerariifolium]